VDGGSDPRSAPMAAVCLQVRVLPGRDRRSFPINHSTVAADQFTGAAQERNSMCRTCRTSFHQLSTIQTVELSK
jgi:hypothetical protein